MGKLDQIAIERGIILESELRRLYLDEYKGCKVIAGIFGIGAMTIHNYLKKFNIPRRNFREASKYYDRSGSNNPMYGKHLSTEQKHQKSIQLRNLIAERGEHWSKGRTISAEERLVRSKAMAGAGNPRWKGGKREKEGYIEIFSPNHPYRNKINKETQSMSID